MAPRILLTLIVALLAVTPIAAEAKPQTVKVMSRNLYLGADLTPGVQATSLQGLSNAAGTIFNEVDTNDFATRAKGLAAEIRSQDPDLVGLQEVALWRTQPCDRVPIPPSATTVRYDWLQLLLTELNKGSRRYRTVISKNEFDFEIFANTDGNEQTSGPNCPFGSEINGRLTMRDVILARVGRVRTSGAKSGTFKTLMQVKPAGAEVNVTRGWTATNAVVKGKRFRFVNAHLEAFDSGTANSTNTGKTVGNGQIREAQGKELVKRGGPASGRLPVILVGDLNSDTTTEVKPGDGRAFRAVLKAGFKRLAATKPYTCCLNVSDMRVSGGGKVSDFDHTVDHVLTNRPKQIRLIKSTVTGRSPVNGFWNSDHAGLFSSLRFR